MFTRIEAREELGARAEARWFGAVAAGAPDARLEDTAQTRNPEAGNLDDLAADITLGKVHRQAVVNGVGLGVLVAKDPAHGPTGGKQRSELLTERDTQFAIAEQDQRARFPCCAVTQDRTEVTVRIAGDDNPTPRGGGDSAARGSDDHAARPNPSRRAAVLIVHPWRPSDTTTTTKTPENNLTSRPGSARAGMMLK